MYCQIKQEFFISSCRQTQKLLFPVIIISRVNFFASTGNFKNKFQPVLNIQHMFRKNKSKLIMEYLLLRKTEKQMKPIISLGSSTESLTFRAVYAHSYLRDWL